MSCNRKWYIGCPVWACEAWRGHLLRSRAPRSSWLQQYSEVFPTVEGNSTFYAIPTPTVVQQWIEQVGDHFRFALKFPRVITHDQALVGCERETQQFLEVLRLLYEAGHLGTSFIQLGPRFAGRQLDQLATYLESLPCELPFAVEVRHLDFFDDGPYERALNGLLELHGIDRVLFDSRPLYSRPPEDAAERKSQTRKPRSPFRDTVTGGRPFVRLIGRNRLEQVQPWIDEWSTRVANWIMAGLQPWVFTHTPDDFFAPEMARRFEAALQVHLPDLEPLAQWPGESETRHRPRELF